MFFSHIWFEVDVTELDLRATVAASEAPAGTDVKTLPAVAALTDSGRVEAVKDLVSGIDGLRTWTFAHQASAPPALEGLSIDLSVEVAKASSAGRTLRDKISNNIIASCKSFIATVERELVTMDFLSDANFISDAAKGKKLRMDFIARDGNANIVRRLNFLLKLKDLMMWVKDDAGKNPEEVLQSVKERLSPPPQKTKKTKCN